MQTQYFADYGYRNFTEYLPYSYKFRGVIYCEVGGLKSRLRGVEEQIMGKDREIVTLKESLIQLRKVHSFLCDG